MFNYNFILTSPITMYIIFRKRTATNKNLAHGSVVGRFKPTKSSSKSHEFVFLINGREDQAHPDRNDFEMQWIVQNLIVPRDNIAEDMLFNQKFPWKDYSRWPKSQYGAFSTNNDLFQNHSIYVNSEIVKRSAKFPPPVVYFDRHKTRTWLTNYQLTPSPYQDFRFIQNPEMMTMSKYKPPTIRRINVVWIIKKWINGTFSDPHKALSWVKICAR